jgi:hypothetical protein
MRSSIRAMALAFGAAVAMPALAAERIAVFDAELHDTSGEGLREDQQARLRLVTEELRRALAASGRYEVVDTAPLRQRIEAGPALRSCAPCAPAAAAELGADLALVTVVNKVSNLILSITLVEVEAGPAGGARRAVHSAEIRGNNDESWLRGTRWLLRNRLLAAPRP